MKKYNKKGKFTYLLKKEEFDVDLYVYDCILYKAKGGVVEDLGQATQKKVSKEVTAAIEAFLEAHPEYKEDV